MHPEQQKAEHGLPPERRSTALPLFRRTGAAARQVRGDRLALLQSRDARGVDVVWESGRAGLLVHDRGGHAEGDAQDVTEACALVEERLMDGVGLRRG